MRRKTKEPNQPRPDEMIREMACDLVRIAIKALMNMGIDRETAGQWSG
jgi:hypothetical protein